MNNWFKKYSGFFLAFLISNLGWLIIVGTIIYVYSYYFSGIHEIKLKNLINIFAFLGFGIAYENVINKYLFQKKINEKINLIQKQIEKDIIPGLGGIGVKYFKDHNLYKYLVTQLESHPKVWNILQFGSWTKNDETNEDVSTYHKKIKIAVLADELKVKRYVAIWSIEHFEHIFQRMKEFESKDYFFHCIIAQDAFPSNTNMIIIDNTEVIIWPFVNVLDQGEDILGYISIKHPDVANYFQAFFEKIFDDNNNHVIKAYNIREPYANDFKEQLRKVHLENS